MAGSALDRCVEQFLTIGPITFSLREKVPEGRMRGLRPEGYALTVHTRSGNPLIRRSAPPAPKGRRKKNTANVVGLVDIGGGGHLG